MLSKPKDTLMKSLCFLILPFFLVGTTCAQDNPKREMRAVWIATVANIDWPSSKDLTVGEQKTEMEELLDLVQQYHMNTVVFQIRPAADALYLSSMEPWSEWLTGEQGKAPEPFYDPLEFVIKECRRRGLDIHVWLNPYRAVKDTLKSSVSEDHITKLHPEWFLDYGNTRYFDPALPQTRDHVSSVISDIVRRYDIDAIHMDDYFYPYRISKVDFPDDSSFVKYPRGYSDDQREDWRRDNVDLVIRQIHDSIKTVKPWVQFGISPFGVWRNIAKDSLGSKTRAGQTNYDDLFADILKWQKEGWIDYITPQIYWHIGFEVADYTVLSEWWSKNAYGAQLFIGQAPYRINAKSKEKSWRSSKEIIKQIKMNRSLANIEGSMFFSAKILRTNPLKLQQHLTRKVYQHLALTPVNKRIDAITCQEPIAPAQGVENKTLHLSWGNVENAKNYIIYKFKTNQDMSKVNATNIFIVTSESSVVIPLERKTNPKRYHYAVSSQSLTNGESIMVPFTERAALVTTR